MASLNRHRADGAPADARRARLLAHPPTLARLHMLARGLACWLVLGALFSCGSPPRNQNPATLWVSFGQTELELVLADKEPPYY